jgi:ceramide glucosyltransferase
MTISTMAAGFAAASLGLHVVSIAFASFRCRAGKPPQPPPAILPPISIVQPLCGVEPFSRETLATVFAIHYPQYEILFCVADAADPIASLTREFMARHPETPARLLTGDDPISGNPKLNNVVKGWKAARHGWIVMADSNVAMPPDYLIRLLSRWRPDTGIVCAPPIGGSPIGFAAGLECAFLNTYQARWQYAGELAGYGFAQGKSMLWRRDVLDDNGGIEALAAEIAEDAASTKLVHRAGLRAHLADRPFQQPLGRRGLRDVWKRQVRWARLRRATFAGYYAVEAVTSGVFTLLAAAIAAPEAGLGRATAFGLAAAIWYGAEALLARAADWPLNAWSPLAWIARDLALPWLWVQGWIGNQYEWRGASLTVGEEELAAGGAGTVGRG